MDWSWLVLLVFTGAATFRLTRLVVKDDFPLIAVPRRWVIGEQYWDEDSQTWSAPKHHDTWYFWFGELISCHWCASGWISLGITGLVALGTDKPGSFVEWLLLWWASWAVGAVAADRSN